MKTRRISVYWYLNIALVFFICCKFSPISNQFTSSIFDSVITSYLIIIFDVFIGKYAYEQSGDGQQQKLDIGMLCNCILAIVYICSVLIDYSISFKWSALQLLAAIGSFLVFYFAFMKFNTQRCFIMILAVSLFGTIAIGEVQYVKTEDKCRTVETYPLPDEDTYHQLKKLYHDFPEEDPYIVLDYTDNSVYVMDLAYGETEYYSFETSKEQKEFICTRTMGLGVDIPILGPNVTFDDSQKEVTCTSWEPSTYADVEKKMTESSSFYFAALMGVLLIASLISHLYEKNK